MQFLKEELQVNEGLKNLIMEQERRDPDNITITDIDIIATEIKSYIYNHACKFSNINEFVISFIKLIERTDDIEIFKAGIKLLSKLLQNSINSFEDIKVLKESIEEVFKKNSKNTYSCNPYNPNIYSRQMLDEVNKNIRKILVDDCIDLFFKNTLLDDYTSGDIFSDIWNSQEQNITKKGDKYYANNTSGKSFNI